MGYFPSRSACLPIVRRFWPRARTILAYELPISLRSLAINRTSAVQSKAELTERKLAEMRHEIIYFLKFPNVDTLRLVLIWCKVVLQCSFNRIEQAPAKCNLNIALSLYDKGPTRNAYTTGYSWAISNTDTIVCTYSFKAQTWLKTYHDESIKN